MTDKIEIPEEIKIRLQEKFIRADLRLSDAERFLYDLIQKQDNEIGVGEWYYRMDEEVIEFSECKDPVEARAANSKARFKKAPKELMAGLEKLREE